MAAAADEMSYTTADPYDLVDFVRFVEDTLVC